MRTILPAMQNKQDILALLKSNFPELRKEFGVKTLGVFGSFARDKLIHDYFGVNFDVVWDVVQTDLPPLIQQLESIV